MSNQDQSKAAIDISPPGGPVFDSVSLISAPTMLFIFYSLMTVTSSLPRALEGSKKPIQVILIILTSTLLICYDVQTCLDQKGQNIYTQIGLNRAATLDQIKETFEQYTTCHTDPTLGCDDPMKRPIYRLTEEQVFDIKYVLTRASRRDRYNKGEMFSRKGQKLIPVSEQSARLVYHELLVNYAGLILIVYYVLPLFKIIEDDQSFTQQVLIGSMTVFAAISALLVMLKEEGTQDNAVVRFINDRSHFDNFCYFEINHMLKHAIFPHLLCAIFLVTKICFDLTPQEVSKESIKHVQTDMTKSLLACEMVTGAMAGGSASSFSRDDINKNEAYTTQDAYRGVLEREKEDKIDFEKEKVKRRVDGSSKGCFGRLGSLMKLLCMLGGCMACCVCMVPLFAPFFIAFYQGFTEGQAEYRMEQPDL